MFHILECVSLSLALHWFQIDSTCAPPYNPDGKPIDVSCESAILASISAAGIPDEILEAKRPPLSLTLVLDKSGSMAGENIRLMRKTAEWVVSQLSARDCLGIVTYDSNVQIALPLTHMDAAGRRAVRTVQVEHIRLTLGLKAPRFQSVESKSLSKLWFQMSTCTPTPRLPLSRRASATEA